MSKRQARMAGRPDLDATVVVAMLFLCLLGFSFLDLDCLD